MTRKKEIITAAVERADRHEIAEKVLNNCNNKFYFYSRVYNAEIASFEAGVEWADEYFKPSWISVEDDLPCSHKELINPEYETETVQVLVNMGGIIGIAKMVKNNHTGEWLWATRVTVYHWMIIPKLPKE